MLDLNRSHHNTYYTVQLTNKFDTNYITVKIEKKKQRRIGQILKLKTTDDIVDVRR